MQKTPKKAVDVVDVQEPIQRGTRLAHLGSGTGGERVSRLTELLRQARKADPQLGADLEAEIGALTKRRTFGLVFEQHQPEAVELPGRAVRRGDKVRALPPRGETKTRDQRLWRVTRTERANGQRMAQLVELDAEEPETQAVPADDLVIVAEFRDRIYPGLIRDTPMRFSPADLGTRLMVVSVVTGALAGGDYADGDYGSFWGSSGPARAVGRADGWGRGGQRAAGCAQGGAGKARSRASMTWASVSYTH